MGEPEMASVLRKGSQVEVLDIEDKPASSLNRVWFWQNTPESPSSKRNYYWLYHQLKWETNARDKGRLMTLQKPLRRIFAKIRVVTPAPVQEDLILHDPCGIPIPCGDRAYEVADPVDLTGGYLETPGAVRYIFLHMAIESLEWTLADDPEPAHPDHDGCRRHEESWENMERIRRRHKRLKARAARGEYAQSDDDEDEDEDYDIGNSFSDHDEEAFDDRCEP
jgi:hypothetical protein